MDRFEESNGKVIDHKTGLVWQKSDDGIKRTWAEAQEYANTLELGGYNLWRLPTIEELIGLVDYTRANPAINPIFDCRSNHYWSSSTYAYYQDYAWHVNFYYGYVAADYKDSSNLYVRCVWLYTEEVFADEA